MEADERSSQLDDPGAKFSPAPDIEVLVGQESTENWSDGILRHVDEWSISPRVSFLVTIAGLIVAFVGLAFLVRDAISHNPSPPILVAFITCAILLVVVSVYWIAESRRAHRLNADRHMIVKLFEDKLSDHIKKESSLEDLDHGKDKIISKNKSIEQLKSATFRRIGDLRAIHSYSLYTIQNDILSNSGDVADRFRNAWRSQQDFLNKYCSLTNQLFSGMKGGAVSANIKVVWDGDRTTRLGEILDTEFGVDRNIPLERLLYQSIARCHVSINNGRQVGPENQPVPLRDNFLFRKFYTRKLPNFFTNNIAESMQLWDQQYEIRDEIKDYVYPDDNTVNDYTRLISVPIYIRGLHYPHQDLQALLVDRFVGILSLDSRDPDVIFENEVDMPIAEQIAFDLASSFYEYFRCVKHLEIRSGQPAA